MAFLPDCGSPRSLSCGRGRGAGEEGHLGRRCETRESAPGGLMGGCDLEYITIKYRPGCSHAASVA